MITFFTVKVDIIYQVVNYISGVDIKGIITSV